jgi:hypothetical protein
MTALGRLFGSLANTLLDLGLPSIQAWLRERVGPAADVAQVSTDGSFIHLDGVRLPIGERGELLVDRATAQLTGARGGGLGLPDVRLQAFRGVLRFGSDAGGDGELRAEVIFAAPESADEAAWVAGELTIVRATWSAGEGRERAPAPAPMEGRARLVVTSAAWSLDDGLLSSEQAKVSFAGRGATDASAVGGAIHDAKLVLDGARVGPFVDAVQAMIGRALAVPPGVPLDARLSGELAWNASTGGKCNLQVIAEGLQAQLAGTVGPEGRELAARLEGDIAPAVPMKRALVAAALLPREQDRLTIVVDARGDASKPDVHATVRGAELGFRFGRPRFQPALLVRGVEVTLDVTGDVASVRGAAKVGGGGQAGQGTLAVDGELPLRSRAGRRLGVKVTDLEPSWISSVLSVLAPEVRIVVEGESTPAGASGAGVFAWPRDARLGCELTVALGGATSVTGEVVVTTPRSRVALAPLVLARRASDAAPSDAAPSDAAPSDAAPSDAAPSEHRSLVTDGTHLVGMLAVADALTAGLFPFDVRPEPAGSITLDLGLYGRLDELVLSGLLTSPSLRLAIVSRPEIAPLVVDDVATALAVDHRSLTYAKGRFRAYGGTFSAEGTIPLEPAAATPGSAAPALLDLHARDASASFIEAVAAFAPGRVRVRAEREGVRPGEEIWIPRTARVSGELRLAADRSIAAEIALETSRPSDPEDAAGTALLATFRLSPEQRVDGSSIRGTVAVADVVASGAVAMDVRPLPEGAARIDATLKGPIDDVVLTGFLAAPRLKLALHEGARVAADAPTFVVTDLTTMVRIDATKIVWHRFEARAYGGTLASAGLLGAGTDGTFVGLQANVSVRDVSAGHLPTDPRGTPLAEIAFGRLSAEMRFERSGVDGPVTGRGRARLDEGAFPVLARARPALGRYGLTPPAERAVGPATLSIALGQLGWSFSDIRGAVPGCAAIGDVRIGFDGSVDGALVVTLGRELLASSAVLVVPSILAEHLTIPVSLGGTLARPKVDADLGACLGRFVTDNRVTAMFSEAASDVVSLFTGRAPSKPAPPLPSDAPPVQERPGVEPQADDALLREVVAAGVDWDEIEARLEEHRRGGVRHRIG